MSWYEFIECFKNTFNWILNSKLFMPVLAGIIIAVICFIYRNRKRTKFIGISDINVFSVTIKVNMKNLDIAYMMFVQLKTRKIGVEFDEEYDVISEVYDSWYSAFQSIRELLMNIKPTPKNKELIHVGNKVLNIGMRPLLTKWQAKFRKWYTLESEKEENNKLTPQEIQKKYPEYHQLICDLKRSQKQILELVDELEKIFT
jgi:hypothetical protein